MIRFDLEPRRLLTALGVVAFLVVFAGVMVTTVPQTVGADHSYVVLSDSMSPTINAGSVVVVSEVPATQIETGDVITYVDSAGGETKHVTHRVVDVKTRNGERVFRTKGDANDSPDPGVVSAGAVVGVVQFHIPYIGYLVNFAGSTLGLVTLVVVPAILLAVSEAWSLYSAERGASE